MNDGEANTQFSKVYTLKTECHQLSTAIELGAVAISFVVRGYRRARGREDRFGVLFLPCCTAPGHWAGNILLDTCPVTYNFHLIFQQRFQSLILKVMCDSSLKPIKLDLQSMQIRENSAL